MREPTYSTFYKCLRAERPAGLPLFKWWMKFRSRKMTHPLCEALCGPNWKQWTTVSGQFRKFLKANAPHVGDNSYLKKITLRCFRQTAMQLASRHRHPEAAKKLEALRKELSVKAPRAWPKRREMPAILREFIDGRMYLLWQKSAPTLQRIEEACSLETGVILATCKAALTPTYIQDIRTTPSRRVPRPNSKLLPLPPKLKAFVRSFTEYKTALVPPMRRFYRWTEGFRGDYPTASIFEVFVRRRFSFMVRPSRLDPAHPDHGLGMTPDSIEPIDLFRSDIAIEHFKWAVAVRGGISSSFAWTYFSYGIAMLNERSGFMYQQPEKFGVQLRGHLETKPIRLSKKVLKERFEEWCRIEYNRCWDFIASLDLRSSQIKYSRVRNSPAKIEKILDLPQPLAALYALVNAQKLDETQLTFASERLRLSHCAGTFFAAAMTALPLRLNTWSGLKCDENVFKENGRWSIRVQRRLFKNRRNMKAAYYEVILPEWVTPFFDEYLNVIRPQLLGAKAGSKYLFTYSEQPTTTAPLDGPLPVHVLRGRIWHITRRYWGAPVGAHGWRHIIATSILKHDCNAIVSAAYVLNSSADTVANTYSHLANRDAFVRFADLSDTLWKAKIEA